MFLATLLCAVSISAATSQGVDPLAAQRADLEAVRDNYVQGSAALSSEARASALAHIATLQGREQALAPADFIIELMRISALAGNGHDFFDTGTGWFPSRRLPFRLLWLSDGLVIARAAPELADLVGARVLSVDGHTPEQIMATLQTLDGSQAGYLRSNKFWLLESSDLLHAAGLADLDDRIRLRVRLDDGREIERSVAAVPSQQVPGDLGRFGVYAAELSPQERTAGWANAVHAGSDPKYLRDTDQQFRIVELPDLDALYLQLRANLDGADETLGEFAARALAALHASQRTHLILDERFNYGGNSDLTLDLMREIGQWQRGRVFVLTSGHTFSAGIVSVALVKQTAKTNAQLVGEAVGDRLRWWSEGHHVCLPNSGYCLHASTGLWDLKDGCSDEPGCYGDRFGIRVDDLDPDLPVAMRIDDWKSGRDPLLEAVARRISH